MHLVFHSHEPLRQGKGRGRDRAQASQRKLQKPDSQDLQLCSSLAQTLDHFAHPHTLPHSELPHVMVSGSQLPLPGACGTAFAVAGLR